MYAQGVVATFDGALDWCKFSRDASCFAAKVTTMNCHQRATVDWTAVRCKLCVKQTSPKLTAIHNFQNASDAKLPQTGFYKA